MGTKRDPHCDNIRSDVQGRVNKKGSVIATNTPRLCLGLAIQLKRQNGKSSTAANIAEVACKIIRNDIKIHIIKYESMLFFDPITKKIFYDI